MSLYFKVRTRRICQGTFPDRRAYCVSPAKASLHALYRYTQDINGTHGVPLHIQIIAIGLFIKTSESKTPLLQLGDTDSLLWTGPRDYL